MSIVTIVGAGMMGSAMSIPLSDNAHEVRLVGTHLDREIIEHIKLHRVHPKLQRPIAETVLPYQIEELPTALSGTEYVICGVSSFGVEWFSDHVVPAILEHVPVLAVTKGLYERDSGELVPFPYLYQEKLSPGRQISFNAIGGPCTSYELADRQHSAVAFCGDDPQVLRQFKQLLQTSYYHISISTDVVGVEVVVALKNAYALGVTLAVGIQQQQFEQGAPLAFNPQAALFGQSMREMELLLKLYGGKPESLVYGIGDLYVTIYGGRTRLLGTLLGSGLTFSEAMEKLEGVTLESVAIAKTVASSLNKKVQQGEADFSDFPLLRHVSDLLNDKTGAIPWDMLEVE